jgi:hypothetical protein
VTLEQITTALEGAEKLKLIPQYQPQQSIAPQMRCTAAPEVVANRLTAGGAIGTLRCTW